MFSRQTDVSAGLQQAAIVCVSCLKPASLKKSRPCKTCYSRAYRRGERFRVARIPTCHPERKHCALGLCVSCYRKAKYTPEEGRRRNRLYDLRHPGARRQYFLRWQKNNPEQNRARRDRRRALENNAPVCDFTLVQWEHIKRSHGHCCHYCGAKTVLERDHVVPLTRGGSHTASNIVPACRKCNNRKGNKDYAVFVQERRSAVGVDRAFAA